MNKHLVAVILCSGLLACSKPKHLQDVMIDDNGYVHHTISYLDDTRGQDVFPKKRHAQGKKLFIFDPKATAWAAYDEEGYRLKTGSASGGKKFCQDLNRSCKTKVGKFRVFSKKGHDCRSNEYPLARDGGVMGGAKMPFCMHFYKDYAIHGTYEVSNHNNSYGCIRVLPGAAQWLNEQFVDIGTEVLVLAYD